jgi:pimeloyl-ACP methyl ester carboxylesterase
MRVARSLGLAMVVVVGGGCSGAAEVSPTTGPSSSPRPAGASTPETPVTTVTDDPSTLPLTATTTPPTTTTASEPAVAAVREAAPCDPAPSAPDRVTCGFLVVPERPGVVGGPTVRMRFAIVTPTDPSDASEPIVFLAGGPGYGSVGAMETFLEDSPVDRPVVLVDYRGVGGSEPTLVCPEDDALAVEGLGTTAADPDLSLRRRAAIQDCHDRLVGAGIDLSAYDYEHIANDLDMLRESLGYDQWDLWGLSNGGRVALEVARRHPEGVRTLVLDAAAPPQGNLIGDLWANADVAFQRLFERCAGDPDCAARYPNLEATFEALVAEFATAHVEVVVPGADGQVDTTVRFDDVVLLNALRQAMYETSLIPLLPFYISELAQGRQFDTVARLIIDRTGADGISDGMALSVNCREELAFLPDGHFQAQAALLPMLAPVLELQAADDWCPIWDVGTADPAIDEPVVSDIPALVLVGEFDPVHPESAARSIARGLSNSTLVVVPGLGHGTLFEADCPRQILSSFLSDPSNVVDDSCVADMTPVVWV